MKNKVVRRSKPYFPRHLQPYHNFVDRWHPDDYRREEIQSLEQAIRAKENRLVLGLPDIGLSNLLRFLVTRTDWGERKVTFAYLDCHALDNCLDFEPFFAEITRQFDEQSLTDKHRESKPGYEYLKSMILKAAGDPLDRLVIVINNTDRLIVAADNAFYRKLRALTDLNKRVCYIFTATANATNVIDPENLLFAGRRLIVGRFNERDLTGAIVEEGQRLGREFNPFEQKQLARLTNGHPGLLRAVSSAIVESGLDLLKSEGKLIENLLTRADVHARCQRIWQALNPMQQVALGNIAGGRLASVSPEILAWLQNFALVEAHNGEYQLFSPIFARFVTTQQVRPVLFEPVRIVGISAIRVNEQEIVVAGKVLKGDCEIPATPLELRLIACLQREPKIYTKDEIAQYVYYDEAGIVEDQRIEDLVRRVRNRLGRDYIKAHWGKGYEFLGREDSVSAT